MTLKVNQPAGKYQWIIVLLLIVLLHFSIGIQDILFLHPQSIHQWAQCDRASVAWNFYKDGLDIFHPRVSNVDNGTGISGMEFPLINFLAAILYKIFGFHEFFYRLISLIIYSTGLVYAFKIAQYWLKNFWYSSAVMVLFGSSALLGFYAANFLPEPSSLSFSLIAWNQLLMYVEERKSKRIYIAFAFLMMACLIKLSSFVNVPAMIVLVSCISEREEKKKYLYLFSGMLLLTVIVAAGWYIYAARLSDNEHSAVFMLRSARAKNWEEFSSIWEEFRKIWFYRIYNDYLLSAMFISLIAGVVVQRARQNKLPLIFVVMSAGAMTFIYMMWAQLNHHDYYMIPLYGMFLFGLIATVQLIRLIPGKLPVVLFVICFTVVLFYHLKTTVVHQRSAYDNTDWKYGWTQFDRYFDFNDYLKSKGVAEREKIISVYDHTPDISLYLMEHKGVTVSFKNTGEQIKKYIYSREFSYLVYNTVSGDSTHVFQAQMFPLLEIGNENGLVLYKINLPGINPDLQERFLFSAWNGTVR